jgi:tetratricopeptide (TPR) repeat protein
MPLAPRDTIPRDPLASPHAAAGHMAVVLLLFALVFIAFSPALSADFVRWDDPVFVVENPNVHGLTLPHLRWMLTAFHGGHFHPLTWFSWALDYDLAGGLKPGQFHFTNILLHAINAVLVYVLLGRLLRLAFARVSASSTPTERTIQLASLLGAAAFALHPLRAESVAWITERRDVLSASFLFGACIAYLGSSRLESPRIDSRRAYIAAIVLLLLSCLAKGWGMTLFAVLLVLDFYPLRRISLDPRTWFSRATIGVVLQKIPFVVIGVASAVLSGKAADASNAVKTLAQWGVRERAVQAAYGLWFYTRATFWPDGLSPLYQLPERINPFEPRYLVAYAFLAVVVIVLIASYKRYPWLLAAAAIYAIWLAPILGFLQSGEQFVADRYSYLGCLIYPALLAGGLAWVLTWARTEPTHAAATNRRPLAFLSVSAAIAATLALALLTFAQTSTWHNTETLWGHAVQATPSSQVLTNYAVELDRLGRAKEADEAALAATKLNPTDGRAWFTYGGRIRDRGNLAEAERAFKEAAKYMPQAYQAYQNLGVLYAKHGHPDAALQMFQLAVADIEKGGRRPLSGGPYMTLGIALQEAKRPGEARAMFEKAAAFPDTREAAAKELEALGK